MYHSVRKSTKYQTLMFGYGFLLASSFFICVPQCEEESQVSDSGVGYGFLLASSFFICVPQCEEESQVSDSGVGYGFLLASFYLCTTV